MKNGVEIDGDRHLKFRAFAIIVAALAFGIFCGATAQAQGQMGVSRNSLLGGGTSVAGQFSLKGVIGQFGAGPAMSGGSFTLSGGFLAAYNPLAQVKDWSIY